MKIPIFGATFMFAVCVCAASISCAEDIQTAGDSGVSAASNGGVPFSLDGLVARAKHMAARQHEPPAEVGEPFAKLTYDKYRLIAPRFEKAFWRKEAAPFWVEPHHAGFLFPYPKKVSTVSAGMAKPWKFDPELFQYRGQAAELATTDGGGFAGFRLLTQFLDRPNHQEFASFLGASYFRVLGAYDWYGASVRGLAIDVGLGTPEEFPRFIEFWMEEPTSQDTFRVWALMDCPAASGAYEFTMRPGETTHVDTRAFIFFRHGVQKVGIAPITSMWMWEGWGKPADDPRSEVHDSDGLLIRDNAGWMWRPLRRPQQTVISKFPATQLRGFGLMQRDREYENYADSETRYHLRPNVWVTPQNDWGNGHVELLELTATHEGVDNIGAYWVPEQPTLDGANYELMYRLSFGQREPESHRLGKFTHTIPQSKINGTHYYLVIEGGKRLRQADRADIEPVIKPRGAKLGEVRFEQQPDGNWLLNFDLIHDPTAAVDVTAVVKRDNEPISETWSYRWTPQP